MDENKPAFPLCVLPKPLRDMVDDLREESSFPPPYTAAALFHVFACAMGNSCTCRFRENWETAPILFTVLVGGPGSIKTHPVSFAMAPLVQRDGTSLAAYAAELEQYRKTPMEQRGAKPLARQRVVRDATMEGLVRVLGSNPAGVCVHVDELKGWLSSFDRYRSGGGDKEAWLSLFSGEPIVVNRKSQDDIDSLARPYASVIGTIQPGVLPKVFQTELDNGFFPRLLFVTDPEDGKPVLWKDSEDLPSDAAGRWERFLAPVMDFADQFNAGGIAPRAYTFDTLARTTIVEWQNNREQSCSEDTNCHAVEFLRKIETYAIRFALVIQVMRDVAEGSFGKTTVIGCEAAILASLLADYFLSTAEDTYEYVVMGGEDPGQKMRLLNSLDVQFTAGQALAVGSVMGMSRRSVYRWLDVGSNNPFIRKIRHGLYEKIL